MLPMQSVEGACRELQYAVKELGFRTGFIRPNPYNARVLHDRAFEPLWAVAQDLDSHWHSWWFRKWTTNIGYGPFPREAALYVTVSRTRLR
jgi:hypothetical protein